MKKLTLIAFSVATSALSAATTVSDVLVHQRWPWSRLADIRFTLATDEPVNVSVEAFSGSKSLGALPQESLTGDKYGLLSGEHAIVFDPSKSGLQSYGRLSDFRVGITTTAADPATTNKLYMIVDLTRENSVKYLTQGDIMGGAWGAYEVSPDWISGVSGTFVWTGVTNYPSLMTDKMVFRRCPATTSDEWRAISSKTTFTMGAHDNMVQSGAHEVTLMKDFWIGVFEVTQAQYARMRFIRDGRETAEMWPSEYSNETYRATRPVEHVQGYYLTASLGPRSPALHTGMMDKLKEFTGLDFNLPTEAQWEYACRAGLTTSWNNGTGIGVNNYTGSDANFAKLGRYDKNNPDTSAPTTCSPDEGGTAKVGSYLCNAWGLYDMHGNVAEFCYDYYAADITSFTVDPIGPASPEGSNSPMVCRGGSHAQAVYRGTANNRASSGYLEDSKIIGFRAVVNVAE